MSIRGVFASHASLPGERGSDLAARVLMTGPAGMAPLLALSSGMPNESVSQTSFSWIEDEHISGNGTVAATIDSSTVTLVVEDAGIWTPQTILMNEDTGEYILITAIATDNVTLTIIRGWAGSTAAALTDGDTLQSIGTAFAEGSDRPSPVTQKGDERLNYVQIFKNGWAITGTAQSINYLTGSQLAHNREMCFNYHSEDIERAMLWGRKGVRAISSQQIRTTNGILAQIEQYGGLVESAATGSVSGALSMKDFRNFFRRIFDVQAKGHPNERIAFCGSQLLELIEQMVMMDSTFNVESKETEYGMTITTISAFGHKVKFVTHPMMVENAKWQGELYVLHPGLIRKRTLRTTWTEEFSAKKQNNSGRDATEGYIAIELGFEVKGARTMGIMRNIQTAVASY